MSDSDLCINIKTVKPGFKASARAMKPNKKGEICRSAHKEIDPKDFETWVNLVRNPLQPKRPIFHDLDGPKKAAKSAPQKAPRHKVFDKL